MKNITILIIASCILSGCIGLSPGNIDLGQPPAPPCPDPKPITLTTEEIIVDTDGSKVLFVHFPKIVDEPIVFQNQDNGQWTVGARIKKPTEISDEN